MAAQCQLLSGLLGGVNKIVHHCTVFLFIITAAFPKARAVHGSPKEDSVSHLLSWGISTFLTAGLIRNKVALCKEGQKMWQIVVPGQLTPHRQNEGDLNSGFSATRSSGFCHSSMKLLVVPLGY